MERPDVYPRLCRISADARHLWANFHPHAHALVSDGVFSPEGEFLPLPSLDITTVMKVFRHLLLERLHQAERFSESFMDNLLSWGHPGFSVFAGPRVEAAALTSLESQARYITRPCLAMDAFHKLEDGIVALETPPEIPAGELRRHGIPGFLRRTPLIAYHLSSFGAAAPYGISFLGSG